MLKLSVFVFSAFLACSAYGQTVVCSKPYEANCPVGDYWFACGLILCETNMDPDPEAYPVVCPEGSVETKIAVDENGNGPTYHLGLEEVTEVNDPGAFYWTNGEVLCRETRSCDFSTICDFEVGTFWCAIDEMGAWTPSKELFYTAVEGEECEITEI